MLWQNKERKNNQFSHRTTNACGKYQCQCKCVCHRQTEYNHTTHDTQQKINKIEWIIYYQCSPLNWHLHVYLLSRSLSLTHRRVQKSILLSAIAQWRRQMEERERENTRELTTFHCWLMKNQFSNFPSVGRSTFDVPSDTIFIENCEFFWLQILKTNKYRLLVCFFPFHSLPFSISARRKLCG